MFYDSQERDFAHEWQGNTTDENENSVRIRVHPRSPSFRAFRLFRGFSLIWFRPKAGLGLIRGSCPSYSSHKAKKSEAKRSSVDCGYAPTIFLPWFSCLI
jgi:hypothetical protein